MEIKELMSERAQENKEFNSIILQPTQDEFENIHGFIDVFPNLVTIDYAPKQFIQQLSDFLGYHFLETEDSDVQREILKRLVDQYHKKGLLITLQKIANRGYSDNYLIGDLTFYRGKIEEGYSSITYPRDHLFRYDRSKWDGGDRWPDLTEWREGVVQIDISIPTDPDARILKLIDDNLTAGLKFYVSILRDISGDIGYVDMIYKPLDDTYDNWVLIDIGVILPYVVFGNYYRHDYSRIDCDRYGSRELVSTDLWEEKKPQAAIHRIFYPIDFGYQVAEVYDEKFMDNYYRYCGIIDGDIAV